METMIKFEIDIMIQAIKRSTKIHMKIDCKKRKMYWSTLFLSIKSLVLLELPLAPLADPIDANDKADYRKRSGLCDQLWCHWLPFILRT